jgi:hypothetical protein
VTPRGVTPPCRNNSSLWGNSGRVPLPITRPIQSLDAGHSVSATALLSQSGQLSIVRLPEADSRAVGASGQRVRPGPRIPTAPWTILSGTICSGRPALHRPRKSIHVRRSGRP